MRPFLQELAGMIWSRYQDRLNHLCIVLPNKRAGLYLKKFLSEEAGKAIWAPRILSVEKLVSEKTGYRFADHFTLMLELYQVHRDLQKEKASLFQEFLHWGSTLISDFNDTDLYLADARKLYNYLDATRALTTWNPDGRPLTDFQKDYLSFFNSLLHYYEKLNERLSAARAVYPGMAFRAMALEPAQFFKKEDPYHYVFAGFNALTPAEEKIFRFLLDEGKADCIWDCDTYYLDDPRQEAGMFLRKYRDEWGLKEFLINGRNWAGAKNISMTGVAGYTGQAKTCGEILNSLSPQEIKETCVVLADENLLLPVLNSIPAEINEFNITMGFPLKMSPLESLIMDFFKMHANAFRAERLYDRQERSLYLRDVLRLLSHPYIVQWTGSTQNPGQPPVSLAVAAELRKDLQYTVPVKTLREQVEKAGSNAWERLSLIFQPWEQEPDDVLESVGNILSHLMDHFATEEQAALEREFVYQYRLIIQSLRQALGSHGIRIDLDSAATVLQQMTQASSIPFYGEPLSGFQLMGVLETRNLDFRNVILLSVNDDIIPGGKMQQSFIPMDIRLEFGLPSYKEKEAVYAYHFYRLLQWSENVHLIYNTEADPLSSGDKSRFAAQLQHELPMANPSALIKERIISLEPVTNLPSTAIRIEKSEALLSLLNEKAVKGFAPSSINTYLGCSLRFYYQELLGFREEEEATESMDAATLGTTLHDVLYSLYRNYLAKPLTKEIIEEIKSRALPGLREEFEKNLRGSDIRYGKNFLLFKVAESFLMNFLELENSRVADPAEERVQVEYCEESLQAAFPYGDDASTKVLLKGRADRIDRVGGHIRVVDYKTGKVEDKEVNRSSLEDAIRGDRTEKSMQLLIYAYLFSKTHPEYQGTIESGIISFRNLSKGMMSLVINGKKELTAEELNEFEKFLQELFREIFDPTIPFEQTTDIKKCSLCPFTQICYR